MCDSLVTIDSLLNNDLKKINEFDLEEFVNKTYLEDDIINVKYRLCELCLYFINKGIKYNDIDSAYQSLFIHYEESILHSNRDIASSFIKMFRLNITSINDVYELFTKTMNIERSGWVNNNIPEKHLESIGEHMYEMTNIAKLYLPDTYDDPLYNKDSIINMLLIHDLGETITGDIPHPLKTIDHDLIEDEIMRGILMGLVFYKSPIGLSYYNAWDEWYKDETINANIAHDLDVVQLNNQLLKYSLSHKEVFTLEELKRWFRRRPKTDLCIDIFDKIISNDPDKVDLFNKIMN